MLNDSENTPMKMGDDLICNSKKRKLYVQPRLQEMGDLRTLTLGSSPGPTESGGGGVQAFSMEGDSWLLPPG